MHRKIKILRYTRDIKEREQFKGKKEKKKQREKRNSENVNLICSECKHLKSEANMRKIGNRLVCEECYDPKEQLDQTEYQKLANNKKIKEKSSNYQPINTNARKSD